MEIQSIRKRSKISWSDLPTEVVQLIMELLRFKVSDVNNFRSVCKHWRHSTEISAYLPHHIRSSVPTKLISSSISLLRHPHTSQLLPWMVLTVESTKDTVHLFNPFSRTPLFSTFLPDLAKFQSTLLATEYHVVADEQCEDLFSSDSFIYGKVVMFLNSCVPSIHNCELLALSDGGRVFGSLPFHKYQFFQEADRGHIDDMIRYKGKNYALDKKGKLYSYCDQFGGYCFYNPVVVCPLIDGTARRKRFVVMVSPSGGDKLCLVLPVNGLDGGPTGAINLHFRVYELKYVRRRKLIRQSSWVWEEMTSFGDDDQVMFVTRDYCFFVAAAEFTGCKLRNCIVFSEDAFPEYNVSKSGWDCRQQSENKVAVFCLDGRVHYSLPVEHYPGLTVMLCSPPPWFLQNASSTLQSQCLLLPSFGEPQEEEIIQSDSNDADRASLQEEVLPASSKELTTEIPSTNAAQGETTRNPPLVRLTEHVAEKETENLVEFSQDGFVPEILDQAAETPSSLEARGEITISPTMDEVELQDREESDPQTLRKETITHSVSKAYIISTTQSNKSENLTVKFEGFDIKRDFLRTLENIWSKHGNIVENSIIRNGDIISRALESLATAVLILKDNSARSLSDCQADYLRCTLSDLRCIHFKVDWFVPYVEKALRLNKCKPLLDSLNMLRQRKAQAAEQRLKLLGELAELDMMEKELEENMANTSKMLHFSGDMDLDQLLGGELP